MRRVLFISLAFALLAPASAHADFGISRFDANPSTVKAGGHPNLTVVTDFSDPAFDVKDIVLDLPPGLVGSPLATSKICSRAQFQSDACPQEAVLGDASSVATISGLPLSSSASGQIYNLEPGPGEPARLGFRLAAALGQVIHRRIKELWPLDRTGGTP